MHNNDGSTVGRPTTDHDYNEKDGEREREDGEAGESREI